MVNAYVQYSDIVRLPGFDWFSDVGDLANRFGGQEVWLFGSAIRDDICDPSDIDIAVFVDNKNDVEGLTAALRERFPDGRVQRAENYGGLGCYSFWSEPFSPPPPHFVIDMVEPSDRTLSIRRSIALQGELIWHKRRDYDQLHSS